MLRDVQSMQAIFQRRPLFAGTRATRQEIVLTSFAVPSRAAPNRKKKEFGLLEHSQSRGPENVCHKAIRAIHLRQPNSKNVSKYVLKI